MSCQPKLSRKRQIFAKVSSDCETLEPLVAADGLLVIDVGADDTPEVNMNEREIARKYLSRVPNVPGAIVGSIQATAELVGSGDLTVAPPVGIYLQGCGYRVINLSNFGIKTPPATESIPRNSILEGATSGATARVVVPITPETKKVFVEMVSGAFQADEQVNVQDGSTNVFVAEGAQISGGFSYQPVSENFSFLSMLLEKDGNFSAMHGALGTASFSFEASTIPKVEFDFTGVVDEDALEVATDAPVGVSTLTAGTLLYSGNKIIKLLRDYNSADIYSTIVFDEINGTVVDNDAFLAENATDGFTINGTPSRAYYGVRNMTDVTYLDVIPDVVQDTETKIGSFTPVFSTISFDMGNTVIPRPDANSKTGLISAYINGRNPNGSIDPEEVALTDFDFYRGWFKGDLFDFGFKIGREEGNTIHFFMPKIQNQNVADGDREGMDTMSLEYEAKGDADDEVEIVFV